MRWSPKQIGLAILAAGLFGLMFFLFWKQLGSGAQFQNERAPLWYYDLSSNKLVRGPDRLPPIEENGQVLVRAYVFSCGECSDAGKRYVGYLERFSPELLKIRAQFKADHYLGPGGMNEADPNTIQAMASDTVQISGPKAKDWVDGFSNEAGAIRKQAQKLCADKSTPKRCDLEEWNP